jgi:hypothetical protein
MKKSNQRHADTPVEVPLLETAWVIERCYSSEPLYWTARGALPWDVPSRAAVRFARKEDAAAVLDAVLGKLGRAVQRTWLSTGEDVT